MKQQTKRTVAIIVVAVILTAVILTAVCTDGFMHWNNYCLFGHDYDESGVCVRCGKDKPTEELEQANGNVVIENIAARGMRLNAAPVALSDDLEMYRITATITPANADDNRIEWHIAWKDPNSLWAIGKNVSDYVELASTLEFSSNANVSCIKDFGEQIIITANSLDNEEATAQCTVDYVQRIKGITFNMPEVSSFSTSFTYDIEYSDYTVASEIVIKSIDSNFRLTTDFQQVLDSNIRAYKCDASECGSQCHGADATGWADGTQFRIHDDCLVLESYDDLDDYVPNGIVGCFVYANRPKYLSCNTLSDWYLENFFKEAVKSVSGNHFYFTIGYSTSYNGKTYEAGTQVVYGRFDGEALYVPVTSIELSQGSIVF